ncbi:MAG: carboxypeptidase M32 [Clostridiales bacterium]|nr:carboxypeptidase M32 [Clostridiales bacterium]
MNLEEAKGKLMELLAKQSAFSHAMAILHLDGSTVAPPNSFGGRGRTLSFLSGEVYKSFINKETDELLNFLLENKENLSPIELKIAEDGREEFDKTSKIPMQEFMEYMKLTNDANHVWEKAKLENDFPAFEPYLEKIVTTLKRFANYRDPGKKPYNVFLDDYEKGYTMEDYDQFFNILKERVVPLIHDSISKHKEVRDNFMKLSYSVDKQKELTEKLIDLLKINRDNFAWAESEHPFTMGINKKDVRFTTHFYETNLSSAIYSTIHEGGHATYELNTADELMYTGLDGGASLGLHESQSRFYENNLGRSKEFTSVIYPIIKELYPEQFSDVSAEDLFNAVNKPEASLIRVEADELTYSLHIMVRYEIECMLFNGDIEVSDLPKVWKEKYQEYLGITPPDDSTGVLQDVHWSEGMFGYFPTYALGSAISAQLAAHMEKEFDYRTDVANGDLSRINAWMSEKVHRHGKLLKPKEIINYACGEDFDPNYYCDYLIKKYSK